MEFLNWRLNNISLTLCTIEMDNQYVYISFLHYYSPFTYRLTLYHRNRQFVRTNEIHCVMIIEKRKRTQFRENLLRVTTL
jgi:hypothetical protein